MPIKPSSLEPNRSIAEERPALRLPKNITPPRLDSRAWGGRFPDRRYFPFYFGNGRDAMLINITGSGDGHWERAPSCADVLSKLHCAGWFKADRRLHGEDYGVYGPLICLGEFAALPMMRNEYLVPRDVRQYFDPKTATLTTFYMQADNRTGEKLELRIQSYLTSTGLFIQEIHVLNAPPCGASYAFSLGTASPTHQNHMVPLHLPQSCEAESRNGGNTVLLRLAWESSGGRPGEDLAARAFSVVGEVKVSSVASRGLPQLQFCEREQRVDHLHTGARFWRAVSFQDDREGENPEAVCAALLEELEREGIEGIRERHLLEWQEYFERSEVAVPDASAQFLYDVSRYLVRANHHPGGFQPVGLLPYQWQGVMFWDAATMHAALLSCGNVAEARAIGDYLRRMLPEGRALAARMGNSGARIEWTTHLDSFTVYEPPGRQFHNNAVWAKLFCFENDCLCLPPEEILGPVEELLGFLVDEFRRHGAVECPGEAFVGIEESGTDPKPYDTWTCAVLLNALCDYRDLCRKSGRTPALHGMDEMIATLEEVIEGNIDKNGVLQSFRNGALPHWGSLIFDLFPNHKALIPTIAAMAENYDAERDLFNFHGSNHYAERAFPWANFWVARCLARAEKPEALRFFLHALGHINYFGGIPERIYYHGENYIEWFSSAHAGLVFGLNTMLAREKEGVLKLLGGIDLAIWDTLSFRRLHAGGGWVVSLAMESGVVKKCTVNNLDTQERRLVIDIPPLGIHHVQTMKPGDNTVCFDAPDSREPGALSPSLGKS